MLGASPRAAAAAAAGAAARLAEWSHPLVACDGAAVHAAPQQQLPYGFGGYPLADLHAAAAAATGFSLKAQPQLPDAAALWQPPHEALRALRGGAGAADAATPLTLLHGGGASAA
jgi:hypothetical protein